MNALRRILVGASPSRTFLRAGVLAGLLVLVSQYCVSPIRAVGISMMPTYDEGQFLFLNRLAYRFSPPLRGDIVAITLPGGQAVLVKRIVGLPEERVRFDDGTIYVNDFPLEEPYVRYRIPWNVEEIALSADEYYVVGDNRSMAAHNHDFGVVERRRLIGKLLR